MSTSSSTSSLGPTSTSADRNDAIARLEAQVAELAAVVDELVLIVEVWSGRGPACTPTPFDEVVAEVKSRRAQAHALDAEKGLSPCRLT